MSPDDWAAATGHPSRSPEQADGTDLPSPEYAHLRRLTHQNGLWEHAERVEPRVEHGFCTDDNARALLVVSRQTSPPADLVELAAIYLSFVLAARTETGHFHNRRSAGGAWEDNVGSDDSQGRAWWGLGTAARLAPAAWMRQAAADAFATSASFSSVHLRANAYATLGASEMLLADPDHMAAADLLQRTSRVIADAARERIPWPETRLTYDNARLPEALIAAGTFLRDRRLISTGTRLLTWLFGVETNGNHFSFTPSTGWTPGESRPGFDQQPLEASAMAEACHRAWCASGDPVWKVRALTAARWFVGENDTGMVLYDEATGGTGDGLMKDSVNENQGAESTLAGIAALQIAARCSAESPEAATY